MSSAMIFLTANWDRLGLSRFGMVADLVPVLLTPRFQTSAHVVHLLLDRRSAAPVLVIKAARRSSGADCALEREAANLRAIHAAKPGGFDSIPRLIAFEQHDGTPLLLETGLQGRVLKPCDVRHSPGTYAERLLQWITELNTATVHAPSGAMGDDAENWSEALEKMVREHPLSGPDLALVERTRELTRPLADASLPVVFEHGDLSAPNILIAGEGAVHVVDWELASPAGLPGQDLFFALAFVAFARAGATSQRKDSAAFTDAFFGPHAWAWPYVERYAERVDLDRSLLPSLFVACWSRYVARRAERLRSSDSTATHPHDRWAKVKSNRYFALWDQAVKRVSELPARRPLRPHVSRSRAEPSKLSEGRACRP